MVKELVTIFVPSSSLDNKVDIYFGIEALAKFESLIEKLNFSKGMFPLINVEEFGIDQKINSWWLKLKERCEHEFQGAKQNSYIHEKCIWKNSKG